jgi:putative redox protein
MQHCRDVGVVDHDDEPASLNQWAKQLRQHRAIDSVPQLGSRPLLILHGTNDRQVPQDDARMLAAHHPSAELRLIDGADHRIRHDPRAVAVLMGWLERQGAEITS